MEGALKEYVLHCMFNEWRQAVVPSLLPRGSGAVSSKHTIPWTSTPAAQRTVSMVVRWVVLEVAWAEGFVAFVGAEFVRIFSVEAVSSR